MEITKKTTKRTIDGKRKRCINGVAEELNEMCIDSILLYKDDWQEIVHDRKKCLDIV